MVISEEITRPKKAFEYHIRDLTEDDAEELASIFKIVYNGQYPLKEYEDPEWIRQQVNNPNIIWKVCADDNERPVGCGVMVLEPEHGRLYGGRTVLLPELQGKGIMNNIGIKPIYEVMNELKDKIRIFWGQSRTEPENIAMQRQLEKLGFRPIALMVDMDTGLGERESEIVQALLFNHAFNNRRKDVKIIPEVQPFYEVTRKQYPKIGREFQVVTPKKIEKKDTSLTFTYTIGKYRDSFRIINTVAGIKTSINTFAASLEIEEYTRGHPQLLNLFLDEILKFCKSRDIKFIEACVSAYEPEEQKLFLEKGFKIAGYFPAYEKTGREVEDRIIMLKLPSVLSTKGFEFTKKSWKTAEIILNHLKLQGEIKVSSRGNQQFYIKQEI